MKVQTENLTPIDVFYRIPTTDLTVDQLKEVMFYLDFDEDAPEFQIALSELAYRTPVLARCEVLEDAKREKSERDLATVNTVYAILGNN